MDAILSAPALPWAAKEDPAVPAEAEKEAHAPDLDTDKAIPLDQIGLAEGSRIEVLWLVELENGENFNRWWGATLEGQAESADQAGPSYTIRYDPDEDEEPDIRTVHFLSEHGMIDLKEKEYMHWRLEGDTYEPSDSDDDEAAAEEGGEGAVLSISDLEQLVGPPDDNPNVLVEGDAYQQRLAADAMNEWKEHLKSFMAARMDQKREAGEDTIVTKDDADEFINIMRSIKKARHN